MGKSFKTQPKGKQRVSSSGKRHSLIFVTWHGSRFETVTLESMATKWGHIEMKFFVFIYCMPPSSCEPALALDVVSQAFFFSFGKHRYREDSI